MQRVRRVFVFVGCSVFGLLGFAILASSARATTFTVTVGADGSVSYSPANLQIHAADTVHWVWSSAFPEHSTTSGTPGNPDGSWDSGVHGAPGSFDHKFNTSGTFQYFCTVHQAAMTGSITVLPAEDTPPVADFSFSPTAPTVGQVVTFSASASDPDGDSIASYRWRFDDGTADQTTAGPTVSHVYSTPGVHHPTLVATDSRGTAGAAAAHMITVLPARTPLRISGLRIRPDRLCLHRGRRCRHPGARIRFTLSEAANVGLRITHRNGRKAGKLIRVMSKTGTNNMRFDPLHLRPGAYVLSVTATTSGGERASVHGRFQIKPG